MTAPDTEPQIASARPAMTAAIMAETGLDEHVLRMLVHRFYDKVRVDSVLGPIFDARIVAWTPHLERMVAFWSSVALMTGRYHGRPMPAHTPLSIDGMHFHRWLDLFRETARDVCTPVGAAHVIERAERIARSLHIAVEEAKVARNLCRFCFDERMTQCPMLPQSTTPPSSPATSRTATTRATASSCRL